jgi:GxxExxY protein
MILSAHLEAEGFCHLLWWNVSFYCFYELNYGGGMNEELDRLTDAIIGAAIAVHCELGPGLLESAYEQCLAYELRQRRFMVVCQKPLPVTYHGVRLDCGYRLDVLVENKVILELKTVERLQPIHEAQLLSYLKMAKIKVGLLINFHALKVTSGIKRIVNNY